MRPGRNPRGVGPGAYAPGFGTYAASLENPCGETATSPWLEPPHPRNCRVPHGRPPAGGCQSPRSSVERELLVRPSGSRQQYLTRTCVVPRGTVIGTMTYEPRSDASKVPDTTRVGVIAWPEQPVGVSVSRPAWAGAAPRPVATTRATT